MVLTPRWLCNRGATAGSRLQRGTRPRVALQERRQWRAMRAASRGAAALVYFCRGRIAPQVSTSSSRICGAVVGPLSLLPPLPFGILGAMDGTVNRCGCTDNVRTKKLRCTNCAARIFAMCSTLVRVRLVPTWSRPSSVSLQPTARVRPNLDVSITLAVDPIKYERCWPNPRSCRQMLRICGVFQQTRAIPIEISATL